MTIFDPSSQPPPSDQSGPVLPPREATELAAGIAQVSDAGLPLEAGLRSLAEEAPSRCLREAYADLAARLEAGVTLEQALQELGDRIPDHVRGLMRAGVEAGGLGGVVSEVGRIQARTGRLQRQLWQSLAYPLLLVALLTAIVLVVKTFAIEALAEFCSGVSADFSWRRATPLPSPVKLLLYMPSLDAPALWGFLGGLLILALGWRRLTTAGFRHRVLASLPIVGPMWRYTALAELLRLLAVLLTQRLPLPRALELSAGALSDRDLASSCRELQAVVEAGGSLGDGFSTKRRLPRTLAPLLDWGAQSGTLTDVLRSAADMYAARAEAQANLARTILPPLIFLLILAVVGALMFGMYNVVLQTIQQLVGLGL